MTWFQTLYSCVAMNNGFINDGSSATSGSLDLDNSPPEGHNLDNSPPNGNTLVNGNQDAKSSRSTLSSGNDESEVDDTPNRAYKWFCDYHSFELEMQQTGDNKLKQALQTINEKGGFNPANFRGRINSNKSGGTVSNIEDAIFNIFKDDSTDQLSLGAFLKRLTELGIPKTDLRLTKMLEHFEALRRRSDESTDYLEPMESLMLSREDFSRCITDNIVLINRILRNKVIIPDWQDFCATIDDIYKSCKENKDGQMPDFIPQLMRQDPDNFGVAICTVDGQRFSRGKAKDAFVVQSCCKAINYALALKEFGSDFVHEHVGHEPSGRMPRELALDYNNKPHNPLINAGAIVICSLIKSDVRPADRYDYIMKFYKQIAGMDYVGFDNATFLAEREVADRNYALGYYLRENKCFPHTTNLQEIMDLYFQLNAIEISCESGSVMAATLANGGICPINDDPVLEPSCVRDVLSLMYSCGMYDYSGQFAFKIGLPAKASVSGMILVVVPNVMGVCLWSPPLDRWGNSVRGVQFCSELVNHFNFHNYDNLKRTQLKMDPRRRRVETKGQQVVNLLFSAANGDVTAMRRYLLQGVDLSMSDYDGRTALHLATAEGHEDCVRFLLSKCRVDPSPTDRWGHTPVEEAKANGHLSIVHLLEKWINRTHRHAIGEREGHSQSLDGPSFSKLNSPRGQTLDLRPYHSQLSGGITPKDSGYGSLPNSTRGEAVD